MRSRRLCASCAPSCAPSPPSCSRLSLHPIRADSLREILVFGSRAGLVKKTRFGFVAEPAPISRRWFAGDFSFRLAGGGWREIVFLAISGSSPARSKTIKQNFSSHYKTSHNYCMTNRDFYRSLDFFIIKTIQAILKTPIPTHQRRIPDEKMDCFIGQFDDDRLMLPVSLGMYAHTFHRLPQPDKQL